MSLPNTVSEPALAVQTGPRLAKAVICAGVGSLILAISAHVAVPFWPVPITLQTLAVLALGVALGPRLAAAAVLTYLVEGLAGLPVFAQGAGTAVLAGPTGGYIVGFLPAAVAAGWAARQGWLRQPISAFVAFLAADAIVFVCGVAWLATLVGGERAIAGGLVPFLLGEALKIALLTAMGQLWLRRLSRP